MRRALWFLLAGGVLALLAGWVVGTRPDLAAQAATPLRQVIGNEGVAQLETAVFTLQDRVRQWQYGLGLAEPAAPSAMDTDRAVVASNFFMVSSRSSQGRLSETGPNGMTIFPFPSGINSQDCFPLSSKPEPLNRFSP